MTNTNKFAFVSSTFLLLCIAGQPSRAGTITFTDAPGTGSTRIAGDRYQSQGVLLATNGAGLFLFRSPVFPGDAYLFGSSTLEQPASDFLGLADRSVIIDFVLPGTATPGVTGAVSFRVRAFSEAAAFSVTVFGADNSLLAAIDGSIFDLNFSFGRTEGDIRRVVFTPVSSLGGIESLSFGAITNAPAAPVPEPAPMLLLGTGLAGVAARLRRRRNS